MGEKSTSITVLWLCFFLNLDHLLKHWVVTSYKHRKIWRRFEHLNISNFWNTQIEIFKYLNISRTVQIDRTPRSTICEWSHVTWRTVWIPDIMDHKQAFLLSDFQTTNQIPDHFHKSILKYQTSPVFRWLLYFCFQLFSPAKRLERFLSRNGSNEKPLSAAAAAAAAKGKHPRIRYDIDNSSKNTVGSENQATKN